MSFIKGTPRSDVLLFPEAIDDYVSDDPVRFIEAFVNNLDPKQMDFFRTTPADAGRPAYGPADSLEQLLEQMSERVRANPEKMKKRKELEEHPWSERYARGSRVSRLKLFIA